MNNQPSQNVPKAKAFRLQGKSYHLTYPSHIPHETIINMFTRLGDITWYSIVHENGHTNDDEGGDEQIYEHTHAAITWRIKLDSTNPRLFDLPRNIPPNVFDPIMVPHEQGWLVAHPHIQKISSIKHGIRIFEEYHKKAPILLTQHGDARSGFSTYEGIRSATTIMDAAEALGIPIKSYQDIALIRNDKPIEPLHVHNFPNSHWLLNHPTDNWHAIYICGPSGHGKTQWALALFRSPFLARAQDQLKDFDPLRHDGIVMDDMQLNTWTRSDKINIFDWDEEGVIHCRYRDAKIPKHTRVVVTSNTNFVDNVCSGMEDAALRRRFTHIINTHGPTYQIIPTPVPVEVEIDHDMMLAFLGDILDEDM